MFLRVALLFLVSLPLAAETHRVDPRNNYSRLICVVPMVGQETPADPRRPQYAPWPPAPAGSRTAIIGFSHQVSDDGKFALVEFIARDRKAFDSIFADKAVKAFEKGKDK